MTELLSSEYICSFIERYYAGCNEADAFKMMGCFTDDAVHYFPPGTHSRLGAVQKRLLINGFNASKTWARAGH